MTTDKRNGIVFLLTPYVAVTGLFDLTSVKKVLRACIATVILKDYCPFISSYIINFFVSLAV